MNETNENFYSHSTDFRCMCDPDPFLGPWAENCNQCNPRSDSRNQILIVNFSVSLMCSNLTKIHWHCLWTNMSRIDQLQPLFDRNPLCANYRRQMQTFHLEPLFDLENS